LSRPIFILSFAPRLSPEGTRPITLGTNPAAFRKGAPAPLNAEAASLDLLKDASFEFGSSDVGQERRWRWLCLWAPYSRREPQWAVAEWEPFRLV